MTFEYENLFKIFLTKFSPIYFRYFYRQLLLFYSKNPAMMEKSIFCTEPASDLLTLKQSINIYFYMNQLPKGSAQIKSQL